MLRENRKVAYITTCFSSVSHTFIRREVQSLIDNGVEIKLYGIRPDLNSNVHFYKTKYLYPLNLILILKSFFKIIYLRPKNLFFGFFSALFNEELNPYLHLKLIYHFILSLQHSVEIIESGCTHIHAHFINVPTTIAMYCSMVSGIPYSFTCHSAGETNLYDVTGLKNKFKKASFVRLISNYQQEDLKRYISYTRKVEIIRCGIDFSDYILKKNLSFNRPVKLLAIGRLVEKKGFIDLIDAVRILKERQIPVTLFIVGNGPLLTKLEMAVKQGEIEEQVKFLLEKDEIEVQNILNSSDILVVPSVTSVTGEKEGIPTVIIEGMRACIPVIATNHSGIPELVIDYETGLLVPEHNSASIAEKIELIINDKNLATDMAIKAFEKVKSMYDQSQITNDLIKLFFMNYAG